MFGDFPGVKNEQTYFRPRSPYGAAKVFAHHITNHYKEAYNIFACCGILFNHESPLRGLEFVTRKITHNIARIKLGLDKKLFLGNINAKRDWGFAGDYVEAMWLMLQQDKPDDYVICTGETHTIRDFLDIAFKQIDIDNWEDWVVIDPEFYRPSEVPYLKGDCSKAIKKLGWRPKYNLEGLIRLMLDAKL